MARGRPRQFDPDQMLDCAMTAFWRDGYSDTTMSGIADQAGVKKPALYSVYDNKEALFLAALDRYISVHSAGPQQVLSETPDAIAAVRGYLRTLAAIHTDPALPGGCLIINTVLEGHSFPATTAERFRGLRSQGSRLLRRRLIQAKREGHLAPNADVGGLVRFFDGQIIAMVSMARDGTSRADLYRFIDQAMAAWPSS